LEVTAAIAPEALQLDVEGLALFEPVSAQRLRRRFPHHGRRRRSTKSPCLDLGGVVRTRLMIPTLLHLCMGSSRDEQYQREDTDDQQQAIQTRPRDMSVTPRKLVAVNHSGVPSSFKPCRRYCFTDLTTQGECCSNRPPEPWRRRKTGPG
jgi:hypothetical protein